MNNKKIFLIVTLSVVVFLLLLIVKDFLQGLLAGTNLTKFQCSKIATIPINCLIILLAIVGIRKYNLQSLAGVSTDFKLSKPLLLLFPLYIIILGFLINSKHLNGALFSNIMLLLISTLSTGFAEEIVFRGFIQSFLLKNAKTKLFFSILIASLIFGLAHLLNLSNSENIYGTIGQVIYAVFFGFGFGALLLKTNKLYPIAIIHGLVNFVFTLNTLPNVVQKTTDSHNLAGALISAVIVLPLFIYSMFLIKKINNQSIVSKIME